MTVRNNCNNRLCDNSQLIFLPQHTTLTWQWLVLPLDLRLLQPEHCLSDVMSQVAQECTNISGPPTALMTVLLIARLLNLWYRMHCTPLTLVSTPVWQWMMLETVAVTLLV